jgi:cytochrome c553
VKYTLLVAALLLWTACPLQATQFAPPLDSIEQRARPCMTCHGKEGRATSDGYFPRIAGKPAGYLFNQLVNFREGNRHFPMMTYLVDRQGDTYLRELADYFASQKLPYAAPVPPPATLDVLNRGRNLVVEGDASRNIPACKDCHGRRLLGVAPAVPGLLGLSQDYLLAQLGAWQNRSRRAHAPDCMAQIVRELGPADINAVSAWLATQTVPVGAKPDEAFEITPPRACGSISPAVPIP